VIETREYVNAATPAVAWSWHWFRRLWPLASR